VRNDPARPGRVLIVVTALSLSFACTTTNVDEGSPPGARITPPGADSGTSFEPAPLEIVSKPQYKNWFDAACALPPSQLRRIRRGYYPGRSPDIIVVPREPNFFGGFLSTSHSGPWDYVQRVPLVFYGPGYVRSRGSVVVNREVTLADVAPTVAELLHTAPPLSSAGRPLDQVLVPRSRRPQPPKLIFTVVWDGGGWNVLDAWPDAWPVLARMIEKGSSVANASVGSSPSVTPAVHTTLGTGVFPKDHGIIGIEMRVDDDRVEAGAYAGKSAGFLETPTLADVYDIATGNIAKVGVLAYKSWHFGMIGHGAMFPGGDRDLAIVLNRSEDPVTNSLYYYSPPYVSRIRGLEWALSKVDTDDGRRDGAWMGHDVLDDPAARRDTPAWVLYQTKILRTLVEREDFGVDDVTDLFYTNFKQIDEVGHNWNMVNPEMRSVLRYTDRALGRLIDFLNSHVGRREWVMVMTADHGQGPDPKAGGAWPIHMTELVLDIDRRFGTRAESLITNTSPVGFWIDRARMNEHRVSAADVANFLLDYRLEQNTQRALPEAYEPRRREPIFAAAFPSTAMGRIWACARRQEGGAGGTQ
jgi:type I phosphodiesterase/nucleotide pyrophosphatase